MRKFSVLIFVFISVFCFVNAQRIVWLDELNLSNADQSAGKAHANQSMWRTPLKVAGETYARGVGTHAFGIIRIKLDGKTQSFKASVGIDDSAPAHELKQASAEFVVIGDNKILWRSGVMHGAEKAKEFSVSLKGVKSLILRTEHAGDGTVGDRTNWLNAQFEVNGKSPETVQRQRDAEYILTPKEPQFPIINSPSIFASHPGNPILFNVPITGIRPMKITSSNLPDGLILNQQTGVITGSIQKSGTYSFDVTASNSIGSDKKTLTVKIGEKLALTPPMGWNSWNIFGHNIDDTKIRAMADALVSTGLINYGYSYINIDDGWQGTRGGKFNAIMPNEKFPDMRDLVDYVHSKGLKIGIYSSPWVQTFAGYIGGSADTPDGKIINSSRRCGEYSFSSNDVKQWVEWGFDYLKYDWVTNDIKNTSEMTELLRKSGRNIVYSISNAAPFELASEWAKLTNAWRTTGDIFDSWCSMTSIGFLQNKWQPYANPGSWNDPDMLIVGKVGWGDEIRDTKLTPNEQYLHISLWSILAAPMMIGCDLSSIDNFTLNLLKNREVIAVNQDVAGIQGKRIYSDPVKQIEIWSKPLKDGSCAVGLFNLGEKSQNISIDFNQLDIEGKQIVRDLWRQRNIGTFQHKFSAKVPIHGVVFVKISKNNAE